MGFDRNTSWAHASWRRVMSGLLAGALVFAACDTGDGKTLSEPTGTLPPPTTTETTDPEFERLGTLASIPLESEIEFSEEFSEEFDGDDFQLTAPWIDGAPMDTRYTCDGVGAAPALSWVEAPFDAVELAVVMVDELSPDTSNGVHWVMAGLGSGTTRLVEDEIPFGAVRAVNSFGTLGWTPPCPDAGSGQQTYRFTVYALGQQAEIADGTPASDAIAFIEAVAFSSSDVLATYER